MAFYGLSLQASNSRFATQTAPTVGSDDQINLITDLATVTGFQKKYNFSLVDSATAEYRGFDRLCCGRQFFFASKKKRFHDFNTRRTQEFSNEFFAMMESPSTTCTSTPETVHKGKKINKQMDPNGPKIEVDCEARYSRYFSSLHHIWFRTNAEMKRTDKKTKRRQ